jgi:hypothetical protein
MTLLVLPLLCYNDEIENHFETPASYESNPYATRTVPSAIGCTLTCAVMFPKVI